MDQIKDNIFNPPLKYLSQLDSVNNVLNGMQSKIDSLEKLVLKTEIGTGFFWSVIGLQLAVFVVLVGLGGWIGWSSIISRFNSIKKDCTDASSDLIELTKNDFKESYNELKSDLTDTIFDVNRAMYFASQSANDEENSFDWAMLTAISVTPENNDQTNHLELWVDASIEHLEKLPIGTKIIIQRLDVFPERIKKIEIIANGTLKEKIEALKKDFYHKAYTRQPPEGLMADEAPF